jgi:hypothetical protein
MAKRTCIHRANVSHDRRAGSKAAFGHFPDFAAWCVMSAVEVRAETRVRGGSTSALTQRGRRDWFRAAAGRFQPLREHLTSSHGKSPLIACPIVGDGLRWASVAPHPRSSFGMRKAGRSLTPSRSRGWAETWPDQPENQTCRSVRCALSMGMTGPLRR